MSKKLIYGLFTGAVALASIGITASLTTKGFSTDSVKDNGNTTSNSVLSDGGLLLDETIYSFLDNSGQLRKTISSDWTQNDLGTDIFNKKEGKEATPISYTISYYLDGEKIEAKDLLGKSGHVKIRYDFKNNEIVDGMYTPFAVATGLVLPSDHFTNISIVNGKAFNDGSRTALVGISFPGLQEDLSISKSTFDIPNFFEVEADAKDFKLDMVMSFASSKVFADLDTSALDTVESLGNELNKVTDAMSQLISGSDRLSDGLKLLFNKSGDLVSGINQLNDGSKKLLDGTGALKNGLSEAYAGAVQLADGTNKASAGSNQLNTEVQSYSKKIEAASAEINTMMQDSDKVMTAASASLDSLLTMVNTDITERHIAEQLSQALGQQVVIPQLTADNFSTVITGLITNVSSNLTEEQLNANPDLKKLVITLKTHKQTLDEIQQLYGKVKTYADKVPTVVEKVKEGISGINQLNDGLKQINTGANQLKDGLKKLSDGSSVLYDGMYSLNSGISMLNANTPALVDGITQLKDGSIALRDGLNTFNEQAIQKLVDVYKGDVQGFVSRLRKVVNLSKNSRDNVKYVYRIDEVK